MKLLRCIWGALVLGGTALAISAQTPETEALESEIIGIEMARADGTFLGLAVEGNAFVLRFYDADKQQIDPDVLRAAVWWQPRTTPGRERTVLNRTGQELRSPARVRPPLVFNATFTLIDETETAVGTYMFSLLDLPEADSAAPASNPSY